MKPNVHFFCRAVLTGHPVVLAEHLITVAPRRVGPVEFAARGTTQVNGLGTLPHDQVLDVGRVVLEHALDRFPELAVAKRLDGGHVPCQVTLQVGVLLEKLLVLQVVVEEAVTVRSAVRKVELARRRLAVWYVIVSLFASGKRQRRPAPAIDRKLQKLLKLLQPVF